MNLLLDTQIALWAIIDSPEIDLNARELITSPSNTIWISTVSLWEISFKHAMSREIMPINASDAIRYFHDAGYNTLAVHAEHITVAESLPTYHSDPFDRLLIAQALSTPLRLMTSNTTVASFSDTIIKI